MVSLSSLAMVVVGAPVVVVGASEVAGAPDVVVAPEVPVGADVVVSVSDDPQPADHTDPATSTKASAITRAAAAGMRLDPRRDGMDEFVRGDDMSILVFVRLASVDRAAGPTPGAPCPKASAVHSKTSVLEIHPLGIDSLESLEFLVEILHLSAERVDDEKAAG